MHFKTAISLWQRTRRCSERTGHLWVIVSVFVSPCFLFVGLLSSLFLSGSLPFSSLHTHTHTHTHIHACSFSFNSPSLLVFLFFSITEQAGLPDTRKVVSSYHVVLNAHGRPVWVVATSDPFKDDEKKQRTHSRRRVTLFSILISHLLRLLSMPSYPQQCTQPLRSVRGDTPRK